MTSCQRDEQLLDAYIGTSSEVRALSCQFLTVSVARYLLCIPNRSSSVIKPGTEHSDVDQSKELSRGESYSTRRLACKLMLLTTYPSVLGAAKQNRKPNCAKYGKRPGSKHGP
uniref:Uncharacterized protein n=1 Tax=Trichuris muris TaxID=70415 RepID=A0A5S6Q920_TRIMR